MPRKPKQTPLIEGQDYYFNDAGLMVLTAQFLRARDYCCGSGCKHCPYTPQEFEAARTGKPNTPNSK